MKNLNETSLIWEHQSRILALEGSMKNIKDVSEDVAVIKNITANTDKNVDKLVTAMDKIDERVTKTETDIGKINERVSIFAVGQTVLSGLIAAVISFYKKS